MKNPHENSETRDRASTNANDFKQVERRIKEVALARKDSTPRVGDTAFPFTNRVLEHHMPEQFRMLNTSTYDGKTDPGYHLDTFKSWMLLQGAVPKVMCQAFSITLPSSPKDETESSN